MQLIVSSFLIAVTKNWTVENSGNLVTLCTIISNSLILLPPPPPPHRQRVLEMRELYEAVSHTEPQLPSSSLGLLGGDPFYDRYPWFRLIGRLAKRNDITLQEDSVAYSCTRVSG